QVLLGGLLRSAGVTPAQRNQSPGPVAPCAIPPASGAEDLHELFRLAIPMQQLRWQGSIPFGARRPDGISWRGKLVASAAAGMTDVSSSSPPQRLTAESVLRRQNVKVHLGVGAG